MTLIYFLPLVVLSLFRVVFFQGHFAPHRRSGDFILSLYLATFIFGIFFHLFYPEQSRFPPSSTAMLFLSLCLVIYFLPILQFQNRQLQQIEIGNILVIRALTIILLIGSIYSILMFISKVSAAFSGDINTYRLAVNTGEINVGSTTIFETIAVGFSTFFGIVQLLGFVCLFSKLFGKYSKIIGTLLLASSLSYVLNSFSYAGRDGVVFWLFSILFNFLLFRSWFGVNLIKGLKHLIIITGILITIFFMIISYSRFSLDTFYYLFSYISQQMVVFNDVYLLDPPLYHGDKSFHDIKSLFVSSENLLDRSQYFQYYISNDIEPWRFKYFVGTFLMDFGPLGTLTLIAITAAFILFLLFSKTVNSTNNRTIKIDTLFLYYLYCQIGFMGVFYFKHSALNNFLLAVFILAIFLRVIIFIPRLKVFLVNRSGEIPHTS
ncbi:MAG: hypothetical protein P8103_14375 [Candidatus Thiodiazotropha sp.]